MEAFNNDISTDGEIKTILVITKSFGKNKTIGEIRKILLNRLEKRIGKLA